MYVILEAFKAKSDYADLELFEFKGQYTFLTQSLLNAGKRWKII